MKRTLSILLALAMCLGVGAYASGEPSGSASGESLPAELAALPTVEAEPWVEVSDERVGLEGPAFDGDGNLYVCSTGMHYPVNYILWIDPEKNIRTVYEGPLSPLGLAFHENGKLFAVCREGELLIMNPDGSDIESVTPTYNGKTFSLNDLCFTADGDLFVTDWQGSVQNPIANVVCPNTSLRMTSNLAIKPGTSEGYMLASGFGAGSWIYTFETLAPAKGSADAGSASGEVSGEASADSRGGSAIVLKGAGILDASHNGEVLDVLVRDRYIVAVGENLAGDEVIDLTGFTLMPGLIDSHVHVAGSSGYGIENLATWAQHGITSVREEGMLSTSGEMEFIGLIEEANADPQSAYLVSCGKYFDVPGGYGMGPTGNMGVVIESDEDIIAEIDYKAELGYPQIKLGINSDTNRMSPEQFITAIDWAHENDMPVAAHVNYARYLEELVGYGLDEAAHTPSDEMSGSLIGSMVANDVRMNTSGSENYEEQKIENLRAFYEAGGVITVGTDLMRNYDTCMTALASEMAVLAKAGLSVQEVIACATHNNALALGIADTGDILPGYQADIVAVKGAVDESFAALNDISFVMNDGVVIVG